MTLSISHSQKEILSGIGAGTLATAASHPMDLLRTRLLLGTSAGASSQLTKGLSFNVALAVFKSGCLWPLQKELHAQTASLDLSESQRRVLSGGIANILPNLVAAPFNLIKVHVLRDHHPTSLTDLVKNVLNTGGVKALFAGMHITMLRDLVWGVSYFSLFPEIRMLLQQETRLTPNQMQFASSLITALFATTFTAPIDALRVHCMNQDKEKHPLKGWKKYHTLCFRVIHPSRANIYATLCGIFRVGVSTAVGHSSYEYIKNKL